MEAQSLTRKVNVLAIDDTPANLVALHAVLAREFNLIEAGSAQEALNLLSRHPAIDVILLDIQMPDMDGFEAASRIKKIPGCENIPIIFITAVYKEDPFIKQGYEAGGIDYFSKPFDPEILRRKVAIYGSFRHKADILAARERQVRETENLLAAGRKLSTTLEALPVGILIVDPQGRVAQTNGVASRIWQEMLNQSSRRVTPDPALHAREGYAALLGWWTAEGNARIESETPLTRALRGGTTTHGFIVNLNSMQLSFSVSPLHGHDAKIMGAVVVIQDITESRKIEEDLEEKIARFISLGVDFEHQAHQEAFRL